MDSKKLTKKQKKALAFRERKGKGKAVDDDADNAVPVDENQDRMEAEDEGRALAGTAEVQAGAKKGKERAGKDVGSGQPARKRKREDEEKVDSVDKPRKKKVKPVKAEGASEDEAGGKASQPSRRYILFVGNLKYTTTEEAVAQHFAKACDQVLPTVRIRKPKPSADGREATKSKGFAFVEFGDWNALQNALKLHQSELDGRMINVELTAGGGGKSESRLEKLKQRNKSLHEERRKSLAKRKKKASEKGTEGEAEQDPGVDVKADALSRPQRYSATSGVKQAPLNKRTWSVPDTLEEAGSNRKTRKKAKSRVLGTGVNAIPVG